MVSRMYVTVLIKFDKDLTEEEMGDILIDADYSFTDGDTGKELDCRIADVAYD